MITSALTLKLVDAAKNKGDFERAKRYWNTFHCQNEITKAGNRIYGKYCKNRFCTVCNSNRKAQVIKQYLPLVKQWPDPQFVTLTVRAVYAQSLSRRLTEVYKNFQKIISKYKKRNQRGKGIRLMGIRSIESNFNPEDLTYNPHIHLVVPDKETAEILVKEWLAIWPKYYTSRKGQRIDPVNNLEKVLIEIMKYTSKVFTDPTMETDKKKKSKLPHRIYVAALDNIIAALERHRCFDRFGFNLPAKKMKVSIRTTLTIYSDLKYSLKLNDWIDPGTDELLTDYQPPPPLMEILKNDIDMVLQ